ncbi:MAG: hypothetical protein JXQ30_00645, partial [Spirochaetes bacterium]|nr:hypothetical protein [Spirochaetota bacterium]
GNGRLRLSPPAMTQAATGNGRATSPPAMTQAATGNGRLRLTALQRLGLYSILVSATHRRVARRKPPQSIRRAEPLEREKGSVSAVDGTRRVAV